MPTTQPVHVTFIHGLANKPKVEHLRRVWLEALAAPHGGDRGFDLGAVGVKDAFTYWADLFYDEPLDEAGYESRADELAESVEAARTTAGPTGQWAEAMRAHYPDAAEAYVEPPVTAETPAYERIPLPGPLKRKLMGEFLREAHDYLFNVDGLRDTIRQRVIDDLQSAPDGARRVLVGHSQGTFIAYDVLTGVAECPRVDGLMTVGSPLGVDEVQDELVWSRENGFPAKLAGDWVNVYDPYDVVARPDPKLANDFKKDGQKVVIDVKEENWGKWRHSATKYLKGTQLRKHLRRLCARE